MLVILESDFTDRNHNTAASVRIGVVTSQKFPFYANESSLGITLAGIVALFLLLYFKVRKFVVNDKMLVYDSAEIVYGFYDGTFNVSPSLVNGLLVIG